MPERLLFYKIWPAVALLAACLLPGVVLAENTDPADDGSQWAWAENVGWINAEPLGDGGPGLEIDDFEVRGWLWGENVGWISLTCENTGSCGAAEYRVRHDGTGALSGWAWAENAGWIDFEPEPDGVYVNVTTGELSGHAWGENIGWISFSSTGPHPYVVRTDWTCDPPPPAPPDPPVLLVSEVDLLAVELAWDPVDFATGYDVVYGELLALHHDPNRYFAATLGCIGENLADTGTAFEGTPPPGDGYWFLVRGVNCGGTGTYNTSGPAQPGDRDEGIGDSGVDCRKP
jgi:hypothetical protein